MVPAPTLGRLVRTGSPDPSAATPPGRPAPLHIQGWSSLPLGVASSRRGCLGHRQKPPHSLARPWRCPFYWGPSPIDAGGRWGFRVLPWLLNPTTPGRGVGPLLTSPDAPGPWCLSVWEPSASFPGTSCTPGKPGCSGQNPGRGSGEAQGPVGPSPRTLSGRPHQRRRALPKADFACGCRAHVGFSPTPALPLWGGALGGGLCGGHAGPPRSWLPLPV